MQLKLLTSGSGRTDGRSQSPCADYQRRSLVRSPGFFHGFHRPPAKLTAHIYAGGFQLAYNACIRVARGS